MAKRKNSSDDENDDYEQSEDDVTKIITSSKKKHGSKATDRPLTIKKPKIDSSDSPSASGSMKKSADHDVKVFTNSEGERYVELGQKKRVTVREFKGKILVDIREFYGKDAEDEKPGKKGISLNSDQWNSLKDSINTIDSFFADHKK